MITYGIDWEIPVLKKLTHPNIDIVNGKIYVDFRPTFIDIPMFKYQYWELHEHSHAFVEVHTMPVRNCTYFIYAAQKLLLNKSLEGSLIWHSHPWENNAAAHYHIVSSSYIPVFMLKVLSFFFLPVFCNSPDFVRDYNVKKHIDYYYSSRIPFNFFCGDVRDGARIISWIATRSDSSDSEQWLELRFPDLPRTPSAVIAIEALVQLARKIKYDFSIEQIETFYRKFSKIRPEICKTADIAPMKQMFPKIYEQIMSYKYYAPEKNRYLEFEKFIKINLFNERWRGDEMLIRNTKFCRKNFDVKIKKRAVIK